MNSINAVNVQPEKALLGNDLVINEDSCNLGCHYCLTGQSNLKSSHENQLIFQPPISDFYSKDSDLGKRLELIIDRVNKKLEPPLIKLTGGEIFIVKGMMEFIERVSEIHETVIVQTNALPLTDEKIERLAKLKNIAVQISLDSSIYEGNSYRVGSEKLHQTLMNKIADVINAGLAVEIYAVLNDRSVLYLKELVEWCGQFKDNPPQLFPFPVRGPDSDKYQVLPEQYHYLDVLHTLQPVYSEVLPPRPYLDRVKSFYVDGGRSWKCHLPRLVISTFSDGVATPCPNIWFHKMGNLTEDSWDSTLEQVNSTGFYQLLLADKPRIDACKGCLTPWDTLSLYFEDLISLDELCRAPSYSPTPVRELLARKKAEYCNA